jgi:hypothetical protein
MIEDSMDKNFKSIYLVCLDQQNDMNYVLARNPSLKKARRAAEKAKTQFPEDEVYITVEKVLKENPVMSYSGLGLGPNYTANLGSNKCVCGHKKGGCVSNLSCRCSAISLCKQMDTEESPFLMLGSSSDDDLEEVEINIVRVSRNLVEVLIPDWADNSIGLSANDFPRDVLTNLEPGVVLTARINIDAESENDLVLKDIKLAYEDEDGDVFDDAEDEYGLDDDEFEEDEFEEFEEFEDFEDDDDEFEEEEEEEEGPEEIASEHSNVASLGWPPSPQEEKAFKLDKEDEFEDKFEEDEETSEE